MVCQVFTSIALFGILIGPLNNFPWVINGIVEALVSVRRLEAFLAARPMARPPPLLMPSGGFPFADCDIHTGGIPGTPGVHPHSDIPAVKGSGGGDRGEGRGCGLGVQAAVCRWCAPQKPVEVEVVTGSDENSTVQCSSGKETVPSGAKGAEGPVESEEAALLSSVGAPSDRLEEGQGEGEGRGEEEGKAGEEGEGRGFRLEVPSLFVPKGSLVLVTGKVRRGPLSQ